MLEPEFTEICRGIAGAEGPIFSSNNEFNIVAPFSARGDTQGGEILRIDLETGKVTYTLNPLIE